VTDLEVGNPATNVIPATAKARLSIRFNDLHRGDALAARIRDVVIKHAPNVTLRAEVSGEAFLTPPGALSDLIAGAIRDTLGVEPELSTTGGTSDARFLSQLCPTVEFGLLNATMHMVDECVAIEDLRDLERVYRAFLNRALHA
jgi:succinyl-diaminopimelate desuccinylase